MKNIIIALSIFISMVSLVYAEEEKSIEIGYSYFYPTLSYINDVFLAASGSRKIEVTPEFNFSFGKYYFTKFPKARKDRVSMGISFWQGDNGSGNNIDASIKSLSFWGRYKYYFLSKYQII